MESCVQAAVLLVSKQHGTGTLPTGQPRSRRRRRKVNQPFGLRRDAHRKRTIALYWLPLSPQMETQLKQSPKGLAVLPTLEGQAAYPRTAAELRLVRQVAQNRKDDKLYVRYDALATTSSV